MAQIKTLERLRLLDSLTEEEKKDLSLFCQERSLKKGEILFKDGDNANSMYFLVEGEIEIYKNISGEDKVLGTISAEEILGEMAIFSGTGKRMASARAVEDTVLLTMLSFSIKELALKHPEILKKIEEIIALREFENKKNN